MRYNSIMKINVHMSAYSTKNDIRTVEVPDNEITPKTTVNQMLALIYHYGQNDFQPQNHPSVSVGDVVGLEGDYYMVLGIGWKKLTESEFKGLPDNIASKPRFLYKMYEA